MSKMYMINEVNNEMCCDYILRCGFTNRADAEEYILSLVEEAAYRDFIYWLLCGRTVEEYFETMKRHNSGYYKTIEYFIDNYSDPGYRVIEGELL